MTRHLLALLILLVCPCCTVADDWNLLFGCGVVGPAQYEQAFYRPMATVNFTGALRLAKISLGGVALSVRATYGVGGMIHKSQSSDLSFDIPFLTYRTRRLAARMGAEIQRGDLQKNLYYVALGRSRPRPGRSRPQAETPID